MKTTLPQMILMILLTVIAVFTILNYLNSFQSLGYVDDNQLNTRIENILETYSWDERIE